MWLLFDCGGFEGSFFVYSWKVIEGFVCFEVGRSREVGFWLLGGWVWVGSGMGASSLINKLLEVIFGFGDCEIFCFCVFVVVLV